MVLLLFCGTGIVTLVSSVIAIILYMFCNLSSAELQLPEYLEHVLEGSFKLHLILRVLNLEGLYVDIMLRMQVYTCEDIIRDATQKFLKFLCLA